MFEARMRRMIVEILEFDTQNDPDRGRGVHIIPCYTISTSK